MIIINNSTNYVKYEREIKIKRLPELVFYFLIVNGLRVEEEHANLRIRAS